VSYAGQPYAIYNHTGFVALLPYIEQLGLFKQYNYQMVGSASNPNNLLLGPDPTNNPNHSTVAGAGVAEALVPIYVCPADVNPPPIENEPGTGFYARKNVRRGNYLFNTGNTTDYNADWASIGSSIRGPFGNNGAAAVNTIKDGTSNTICIGESVQKHHNGSTIFGPYPLSGTHTSVHGQSVAANFAPNYPYGNCATNPNNASLKCTYAWGFSSFHSGITNFVWCDGSVRPIADGIVAATWAAVSTAEGGEVATNMP